MAPGLARRPRQLLRPLRALIDPGPKDADLVGRQPISLRGHPLFRVEARDATDEVALGTVAGPDGLDAVAAAPEGRRLLVEPQAGLLLLRPVAGVAACLEDRSDVPSVIDGPRRARRPIGRILRGRRARVAPAQTRPSAQAESSKRAIGGVRMIQTASPSTRRLPGRAKRDRSSG